MCCYACLGLLVCWLGIRIIRDNVLYVDAFGFCRSLFLFFLVDREEGMVCIRVWLGWDVIVGGDEMG